MTTRSNVGSVALIFLSLLLVAPLVEARTSRLLPSTATTTTPATSVAPVTTSASCVTLTRWLAASGTANRDATTGGEVTLLQKFLISQGLLSGTPTGFFGSMTQAAVQAFQKRENIVSSGSPTTNGYGAVGPTTRARIKAVSCAGTAATSAAGSSANTAPVATSFATATALSYRTLGVDKGSQAEILELSLAAGATARPVARWNLYSICPSGVTISSFLGSACGERSVAASGSAGLTVVRFFVRNDGGSGATIPVQAFAYDAAGGLIGIARATLSVSRTVGAEESVSQVTVLSPNSGETVYAGEKIAVSWLAGAGVYGFSADSKTDILIRQNGVVKASFLDLKNDGAETVPLPETLPAGDYFVTVRVSASNGSQTDDSDKAIVVLPKRSVPKVTLVAPLSGAAWQVGRPFVVQWEGENLGTSTVADVVFVGKNGARFRWTGPARPGSASVSPPPSVCAEPCPGVRTATPLASPYTMAVVLYDLPEGNAARTELARSGSVSVSIGASASSDVPTLTVSAPEQSRSIGATVAALTASFYSASGAVKPATTTVQIICPSVTTVGIRPQYKAESLCGKTVALPLVSGTRYRIATEAWNTGTTNQTISLLARAYDAFGYEIATGRYEYVVKPTGPTASKVITFSSPSSGGSYTGGTTVSVRWGGIDGTFEHYRLDVGNDDRTGTVTVVPMIQRGVSEVNITAAEIAGALPALPGTTPPTTGYFFRIFAISGNSYTASGESARFAFNRTLAAGEAGNTAIARLLAELSASLTALLSAVSR